MQRYFLATRVEAKPGVEFSITGDTFHHWVHVMRATPAEKAEFVTPEQAILIGELQAVQAETATVKVVEVLTQHTELPLQVCIACGLSKGDKPEQIVQRGTELGAHSFIFFDSEYAVAKWASNKRQRKLQRLEKVALNAAQQAHRTWIPTVDYLPNLTALTQVPFDAGVVAWEESAKQHEHAQLPTTLHSMQPGQRLLAVFGPEGGLTEAEVELLKKHQILPAGLGPRIMRAETAPLYLLAAVSFSQELL